MDILAFIKNNLRIDGIEEDEYLNILIDSAKEFLENAGVKYSECKLYNITIAKIVTEWYENRENNNNLSLGIVGMINQLRYKEGAI